MWHNQVDYEQNYFDRLEEAKRQYFQEYGKKFPAYEEKIGKNSLRSLSSVKKSGLCEFVAAIELESGSVGLEFEFSNEMDINASRCSAEQDAHNRNQIQKMRTTDIPKLNRVSNWGSTRGPDSTDSTEMGRLVDDYNSTAGFTYYVCLPSYNEFAAAYNSEFVPAFNNANIQKTRGMEVVWGNANGDLGQLRAAVTEISDIRNVFETSPSGGQGVSGIRQAHDKFVRIERKTRTYTLTLYDFGGGRVEDPAKYSAEITNSSQSEAEISAITELDLVRDEYVVKSRQVPHASEFTQSKSSTHFSFAELNSGHYSWAVITDALLSQLENVRKLVGNKPVAILSGYRNPVHNDSLPDHSPTSRHQYGDAADTNPSDYNGDGTVNSTDRDLLKQAAYDSGFNEVIPKRISVHMANE